MGQGGRGCWGFAQTPGQLRRKNAAGGSAPTPTLGGPAANPVQGVFGREPHRESGVEPPATFLRRSAPGTAVPPPPLATTLSTQTWVASIFVGDGNQCDSDPCMNGGTCNDLIGSFSCSCPSEFGGDLCEMRKCGAGGCKT